MKNKDAELKDLLKEKKYKLTPQRQRLLSLFQEKPGEHLSAEDVYRLIQDERSGIGLATIYRTLELLSGMGMLKKLHFGDGRYRYELNIDSSQHQHHHLFCLGCDKVMEFDGDLLDALENSIKKKNGFHVVDHNVTFLGYCKDCSQNNK